MRTSDRLTNMSGTLLFWSMDALLKSSMPRLLKFVLLPPTFLFCIISIITVGLVFLPSIFVVILWEMTAPPSESTTEREFILKMQADRRASAETTPQD